MFASTLERPAPPELRDRVMNVLSQEWSERAAPVARAGPSRLAHRVRGLAHPRGDRPAVRADPAWSCPRGRERRDQLRHGPCHAGRHGVQGGHARSGECLAGGGQRRRLRIQQRPIVRRRLRPNPGAHGRGSLLVSGSDGTTWDPGPIEFDGDGDAAVWWVTDRSISSMTGLTVRAPDGSVLATAGLRHA